MEFGQLTAVVAAAALLGGGLAGMGWLIARALAGYERAVRDYQREAVFLLALLKQGRKPQGEGKKDEQ